MNIEDLYQISGENGLVTKLEKVKFTPYFLHLIPDGCNSEHDNFVKIESIQDVLDASNCDCFFANLLDALSDGDFLETIEDKASQTDIELTYTFLQSFGSKQKANIVYKYAYPFTEKDEIEQQIFLSNNC